MNKDITRARETVQSLFANDTRNALKLSITDYAVDQAANLVECVSEDFHAQEKMILLDQVKFAKRLSQARNLLNYGDFESSDWSGENGWRTSPHVHVKSNNPIFKGHYLHIPGAMSPQFSNNTYSTYVYQKVDESKLKSYTRYLVRGFVGNSKDLQLLVERYGKEVHVEMDVPDDMQYTLPMNECGGFDRCKPTSYQTRNPHTCTCKDTAYTDTDCQCKDKMNRLTTGVYTNMPVDSSMYADGYHTHTSCGCGNKNMYQNGKHTHTSCGCKNPHVFSFHIDTGYVDLEENVGLLFALKIVSTNGVANIDNLEIIEGKPLTGEALARVKKREHKWKEKMKQKRCKTEEAVQAAQTAIQALFTNAEYNRLKFETLFPHILHADELVQGIPYLYHPFFKGALPPVPGMNDKLFQQLSDLVGRARGFYEMRNLVQNGTFSSGTGNWHVTDGVTTQPEGNTSVLVLREWSDQVIQHLRIDADRGYVLRVTARKEGGGKGTVTMSDCAAYTETLTFTSCDYNTLGSQTMTSGTLSGYVTKTLEIFPDTDRIRIDIGATEGVFKVESVELICMEQMEDRMYGMAGNVEEEM
ncbi:pesticidial crystal protein [Bacillus cereus]|uniref:pesticidial crystal protein n=1 Tax=Bacillus cereus TaxID=1396 RepID=UPI000BF39BC1|nr:pesticidial crystal protein [Bacillus cereus]PFV56577.1 pesticidial crystal protein [Bacillus cereus]